MDYLSVSSVLNMLSSSDEESEELALMAKCAERQLSDPIPIPCPNCGGGKAGVVTPRPTHLPTLFRPDQRYFEFGRGNGPIQKDIERY